MRDEKKSLAEISQFDIDRFGVDVCDMAKRRLLRFLYEARIGAALLAFFEEYDTAIIDRTDDGDGSDRFTVAPMKTGLDLQERKKPATRSTVVEAIEAILGIELPGKKCRRRKCVMGRILQPMTNFSLDKTQLDGRNKYCRKCESVRTKPYAKARTKAAKAALAAQNGTADLG